jgi:hypothetical protein
MPASRCSGPSSGVATGGGQGGGTACAMLGVPPMPGGSGGSRCCAGGRAAAAVAGPGAGCSPVSGRGMPSEAPWAVGELPKSPQPLAACGPVLRASYRPVLRASCRPVLRASCSCDADAGVAKPAGDSGCERCVPSAGDTGSACPSGLGPVPFSGGPGG